MLQTIRDHSGEADCWTQNVFAFQPPDGQTAPMEPLVLHDHTGGIFIEDGDVVEASIAQTNFKGWLMVAEACAPAVVRAIGHLDPDATREQFVTDLFASETPQDGPIIILQTTTQPAVKGCPKPTENTVWLAMRDRAAFDNPGAWLQEFVTLTFPEARELAEAASREEAPASLRKTYPHLLDVILPGSVDVVLALRLLAEGWWMTHVEKTPALHGISIHLPPEAGDWFKPFGESATPSAIAKRMISDDAAEAARKLLEEVRNPSEGREALEEAVRNFLVASPFPQKSA